MRTTQECCFEQILEAAPLKTTAIWILSAHLKKINRIKQTRNTGEAMTNS